LSESNKALLDWFGKRKESSVTEDARGHALSICDCASDLRNVLDCMARGDPEGARKGIERLILAEDESVRVSERLCVRISRGEIDPRARMDLIRYVRKTQTIAGLTKEGAIRVQLALETAAAVPQEVWKEISATVSELAEEVRFIAAAIEAVDSDPKEANRQAEAVSDQERVIDGMYYSSLKHIYLSEMDTRALLIVSGLIECIEDAADAGKDCVDIIQIMLAAKGI